MKVIGIGKGASGKGHVHAVVAFLPEGNVAEIPVALCDKRNQNIVIDNKLDNAAITCPKCLKHSLVSGTPPVKKTTKKALVKKASTIPDTIPESKGEDHFVATKKHNDFYLIHHVPSGKNFFDHVDGRVAPLALVMLNEFEQKWEKDQPLPEHFIANVRKIVSAAYKSVKVKVPKHLTQKPRKQKKKKPREGDTERIKINGEMVMHVFSEKKKDWVPEVDYLAEKQAKADKAKAKESKKKAKADKAKAKESKTVIRRRKGKDKVVPAKGSGKIKRREKAEGNEHGQIIGKPPAVVADMMYKGATLQEMVYELKAQFGLTEKRCVAKVKGLTRKFVRQKGFLINISMKSADEMSDHYRIVGKETGESKAKSKLKRRKK